MHSGERTSPARVLFAYDEVHTQGVYDYPVTARTGFVATLWGSSYIAGGYIALIVAASLLGIGVRMFDVT